MKTRITEEEISSTFKQALKKKIIKPVKDTASIFYNLSFLEERILDLEKQFPENTLHSIAMKANPLFRIQEKIRDLGAGSEVASLPELQLAIAAGFERDKIVFDSPCKTLEEIAFALEMGVHLNADSFHELERIDQLLKKMKSDSVIGIRINPQVGTGSIKSTSVAGTISKFGVPLLTGRQELFKAFRKYPWLTGVHLHIGSQGMPVDLLTKGMKRVLDFTEEVNSLLQKPNGKKRITVFDIGGGLAVSYRQNREAISMQQYRTSLGKEVPALFSGDYRLITEFGRYIHTNTAWAASRVEYVKREKDYNIIMSHLGADFMLRECYNPQDWHHEIGVMDADGNLKNPAKKEKYFIAGPLCFAGDIIGHDLELPLVEEGDYLIIHDVGGYTLSMWSRYNSRQVPMVVGYRNDELEVLKEREGIEEVIGFWR